MSPLSNPSKIFFPKYKFFFVNILNPTSLKIIQFFGCPEKFEKVAWSKPFMYCLFCRNKPADGEDRFLVTFGKLVMDSEKSRYKRQRVANATDIDDGK